jgi:hypothetical protein
MYVFRYILGLKPSGANINLITGEAIHLGLEALMKHPESPETGLMVMRGDVEQFLHQFTNNPFMLEQTDKLTVAKAQVLSLLEEWPAYYANFFEEWEVCELELSIRMAEGTLTSDPIAERMAGKLDGILKRRADNTLWILENKSKRYLTGFNWAGNLELDYQIMWYAIIAKMGGYGISGCLYNTIGKPQHRLSKTGYEDLKFRMSNAIAAEPEKYFAMVPIDINEDKLGRMEIHFARVVENIDLLHESEKYIWPLMNTSRCGDFGGCPYAPLCQAGADAFYPAEVMNMPEANLYEVVEPHGEL